LRKKPNVRIAPAKGRLGVMLPGVGAETGLHLPICS
jgi:hypothetical protein